MKPCGRGYFISMKHSGNWAVKDLPSRPTSHGYCEGISEAQVHSIFLELTVWNSSGFKWPKSIFLLNITPCSDIKTENCCAAKWPNFLEYTAKPEWTSYTVMTDGLLFESRTSFFTSCTCSQTPGSQWLIIPTSSLGFLFISIALFFPLVIFTNSETLSHPHARCDFFLF